jgi:hypothetical protein
MSAAFGGKPSAKEGKLALGFTGLDTRNHPGGVVVARMKAYLGG